MVAWVDEYTVFEPTCTDCLWTGEICESPDEAEAAADAHNAEKHPDTAQAERA